MSKIDRGELDNTLAAMFSNVKYRQSYLYYAHIISQCTIKMDNTLPAPAGISFEHDHYNLFINKDKFDAYDLVTRLAILKHEALHIVYGHVQRTDGRVHLPWNFATDCALNQHIDPDHVKDNWITPKTLGKQLDTVVPKNESAEFYYELIKDKSDKQNQSNQSTESSEINSEDMESDMELADTHQTWQDSKGDEDLQKSVTKGMIEKAQENTIKQNGTVPKECAKWLDLMTHKSELNWKKVLRGIIGNKKVNKRSTLTRPNRRFPKREDIKGHIKDRTFDLLVIADVSGSMSDKAVLHTLGEVRGVCEVTKTNVDLIQIDTTAYEPEKLSKSTKVVTRKGNGGTILSPALAKAKENNIQFQAIVILTDGGLSTDDIAEFKKLNKKVIWLIEPNGFIHPHMDDGKMKSFKLSDPKVKVKSK